MGYIEINVAAILGCKDLAGSAVSKTGHARNRITDVVNSLAPEIRGRNNIVHQTNELLQLLDSVNYDIKHIAETVENGAVRYSNTDYSLKMYRHELLDQ